MMNKNWKVEIRKDCKVCGEPITHPRSRTYCSLKCRQKFQNKKNYYDNNKNEWQRKRSGAKEEGKIQCLVCGLWYWKVGAHVTQRHELTAREYREYFQLEVKRGIAPEHLRREWAKNALDNQMDQRLEKWGEKTRFKKGQPGLGQYERSPITIARFKNNRFKK